MIHTANQADAKTVYGFLSTTLYEYLDCLVDKFKRLLATESITFTIEVTDKDIMIEALAFNDIDKIKMWVDSIGFVAKLYRECEPDVEHHWAGGTLVKTELHAQERELDDCTKEVMNELKVYGDGLKWIAGGVINFYRLMRGEENANS